MKVDPVAHDLYLRGRAYPSEISVPALSGQVALLREAVERAPAFAEAWGRLALMKAGLSTLLPSAEAAATREGARGDALHALELEPRCAEAAIALAQLCPVLGAFGERARWIDQARSWAPNDSFVLSMYGQFLASQGRFRDAVEVLRQAVDLDPLYAERRTLLGLLVRATGRLDEAEAVFEDVMAGWPDFFGAPLALILTLGLKREFGRARALLDRPGLDPWRRGLVYVLNVLEDGSEDVRRRPLDYLRRQFERTGRVGLDGLAFVCHVGHAQEALGIALAAEFGPSPDTLNPRGTEEYEPSTLFVAFYPEIRRDPRFVALCHRLGLVDYWLEADVWPDCVDEVAPYYDFKAECRRVAADAPA